MIFRFGVLAVLAVGMALAAPAAKKPVAKSAAAK